MEKLKENIKPLLFGLGCLALVIFLLVQSSGSNNKTNTESTSSQSSEQKSDDNTNKDNEAPVADENGITKTPNDTFAVTVAKGDNQTKIVRRIIDRYIKEQSTVLVAEQRVYIETVLVDALPRNNLIFVGQTIQVSKASLENTVLKAQQLTKTQLARWSKYV